MAIDHEQFGSRHEHHRFHSRGHGGVGRHLGCNDRLLHRLACLNGKPLARGTGGRREAGACAGRRTCAGLSRHLPGGRGRQRVVGKAAHQSPLHLTGTGAIALGFQLVRPGEQLSGVQGLQAGLELLFGLRGLFALAPVLGLCGEARLLCGLAHRRLARGGQVDLGASAGHVVLRADGQLVACVPAFFGQCPVGAIFPSLAAFLPLESALEPGAIRAKVAPLYGSAVVSDVAVAPDEQDVRCALQLVLHELAALHFAA
ncbi:hypothetical protein D9M72_479080 [compost metagenome]